MIVLDTDTPTPFLAGQPREVFDDMRRVWAERGAPGGSPG